VIVKKAEGTTVTVDGGFPLSMTLAAPEEMHLYTRKQRDELVAHWRGIGFSMGLMAGVLITVLCFIAAVWFTAA
jgi:hypothetical protein